MHNVVCFNCHRTPDQISEYSEEMTGNPDPIAYVQREEGTYNRDNGHFCCTDCYISIGMPSSPTGWRAP